MAGPPKNNLAEQLAIYRANSSSKPPQTPVAGGKKVFSFHKPGGVSKPFTPPARAPCSSLQNSVPPTAQRIEPGTRQPLSQPLSQFRQYARATSQSGGHTDLRVVQEGGSEGRAAGVLQRGSTRPQGQIPGPHGNHTSPPIALVAPVVASGGCGTSDNVTRKGENEPLGGQKGTPGNISLIAPPSKPYLALPPGSSLALSQISSTPSLPPPVKTSDLEKTLKEVHDQRVQVMDTLCDFLSDIPAAKISAMFGVSADHIQRKLAIRKQLLCKEEDLQRRISDQSGTSTPSITPSPLSQPHPHTSTLTTHQSPQPTSTTSPLTLHPPTDTTTHAPTNNDHPWELEEDIPDTFSDEEEDFFPPFTHRDTPTPPTTIVGEKSVATSAMMDGAITTSAAQFTRSPEEMEAAEVIEVEASPPQSVVTNHQRSYKPPPLFKPPFSSSSSSSSTTTCVSHHLSKPSHGAMPDDSQEFQGQYAHAQDLMKIFTQVFGLQQFRPKQLEAINASLLEKDCFVLMPTGGGKSLCYQLPALMTPGVTIVVSPLRSLIQDQVQKLCSLEIPARYLSSDLSASDESNVYGSLVLRDPTTKLLYVTPEKLGASNKLLSMLRNLYNRQKLARFVIDEAHCISQWGHDFRPDYKRLSELRVNYPQVPVMALTATATPRVRADILHQLSMRGTKWFTRSFNRTNLQYSVTPKKPKKIAEDIIALIKTSFKGQSGIVYCLSRRDCEVMAGELMKAGIAALCYHAGLSDGERSTVQQRWVQEEQCKVVCATIAFGMGIDKPDVRFVIHHSMPKSIEGYYQEAGRAGRDGQPASCFLFYNYSDMGRMRRMIKAERMSWEQERTHLENLYRMVQYCENEADCRRAQILEYFAESFDSSECRRGPTPCDNCRSRVPFHTEDVTGLVRVIVESVRSIKGDKYTLVQILEALKGSSSSRIMSSELGSLPLYGRGGRLGKHDLERLLHTLVMRDILAESLHIGNHDNVVCYVKLGSKSGDILSGRSGKVTLRIRGKVQALSTSSDAKKTQSKEDEVREECYKALLNLRIAVAQRCKMRNPENVFSTDTLRAMSKTLPTTQEDMLKVVGVTIVKWKNFDGEGFLQVTQKFASQVPIGDTRSPYWGGKENSMPGGKGKRKGRGSSGAPRAKKPAVVRVAEDSGDEFEPATCSQTQKPGLLPPPVPHRTN